MKIYFTIFTLVFCCFFGGFQAEAKPSQNDREMVLKVGYFVSDSGMFGEKGHPKAGYSYEFLQRIAGYTGWKYEYTEGDYCEILEKVKKGEVDIMVDVIQTPELEAEVLFPEQTLGVKGYTLATPETNVAICVAEDIQGKTIALIGGSYGEVCVREYLKKKGFQCNILLCKDGQEINQALEQGKADCSAIPDGAIKYEGSNYNTFKMKTIDIIDPGRPFSFVVTKQRPHLVEQLNKVILNIKKNDPDYFEHVYARYVQKYSFSGFSGLSEEDKEWVLRNDMIKVGYLENFMPFCWTDEEGDFEGVFRKIFDDFQHRFSLAYETKEYETYEKLLAALKKGEIDAIAAAIGSPWYAEKSGVAITPPVATTQIRVLSRKNFKLRSEMTCAVNKASTHQKQYIKEHHANLTPIFFSSDEEALQAVRDGLVDVMYMSEVRFEFLFHDHEDWFYGMSYPLAANEFIRISVAVRSGEPNLLSILDCGLRTIDQGIIQTEIIEGFRYNEKVTLGSFVRSHAVKVTIFVLVLLLLVGICSAEFIHQERRHSHALEEAEVRARRASEAKSEFLSRVSHDIRTPMNAIMGMSTFILRDIENPEKIAEHMVKIMASSRILLGLVNDILDSSAIESGKMRLAKEPFELGKTLQGLYSIYQAQCLDKGIRFTTKEINVTENHLVGDDKRLTQIVMNLLSNAFKFTERGGSISVFVEQLGIQKRDEGGRIVSFRFEVQDTGCGIGEDKIAKIFDPFEQGGDDVAYRYGGSGLGLNIVKKLIGMMGGTIRVESKEGEGATFISEIPFLIDEQSAGEKGREEKELKRKSNEHFDFTGMRILIADDDEFNREVVGGLLEMVGAEVEKTENGSEALELFLTSEFGHFNVLLLDVHMPIMGGREVVREIRASKRKDAMSVAIFALTADAFPEDVEKSKESGMTGHLTKPISPKELYEALADTRQRSGANTSE